MLIFLECYKKVRAAAINTSKVLPPWGLHPNRRKKFKNKSKKVKVSPESDDILFILKSSYGKAMHVTPFR